MNEFSLGIFGVIGAVLFFLYRQIMRHGVEDTLKKTADEDKSLYQRQFEAKQKMAQIDRELDDLYKQREKLKNQSPEDEAKTWDDQQS